MIFSILAKFRLACRRALAALNGNASRVLLVALLSCSPFFGRADVSQTSFDELLKCFETFYDDWGGFAGFNEDMDGKINYLTKRLDFNTSERLRLYSNFLFPYLSNLSNVISQVRVDLRGFDNVTNSVRSVYDQLKETHDLIDGDLKTAIQGVSYYLEMIKDDFREFYVSEGLPELKEFHECFDDFYDLFYDEFMYDWNVFTRSFDDYSLDVMTKLAEIANALKGTIKIDVNNVGDIWASFPQNLYLPVELSNIDDLISALLETELKVKVDGLSGSGSDGENMNIFELLEKIVEYLEGTQKPFYLGYNATTNELLNSYYKRPIDVYMAYASPNQFASLIKADAIGQLVNGSNADFFHTIVDIFNMQATFFENFDKSLINLQLLLAPTNAVDSSGAVDWIANSGDKMDEVKSILGLELPSFDMDFDDTTPLDKLEGAGSTLPSSVTIDGITVFDIHIPDIVIDVDAFASGFQLMRYVCITAYWSITLILFFVIVYYFCRALIWFMGQVKEIKFD